jgi:dihydropteroate synthase
MAGASIVNDVWGLQKDENMAEVISKTGAGVVVMHNSDNKEYEDLMGDIIRFLRESIKIAENVGVRRESIVVDPGIGFGKTLQHNLDVMRRLKELDSLNVPVLIGTSRKSLIGNILELPVNERLEGTAATVTLGIANGADIVRVHDVKEMVRVARMTDAMVRI